MRKYIKVNDRLAVFSSDYLRKVSNSTEQMYEAKYVAQVGNAMTENTTRKFEEIMMRVDSMMPQLQKTFSIVDMVGTYAEQVAESSVEMTLKTTGNAERM